MVLGPSDDGRPVRLGRWDFSSDQVESYWQSSGQGTGIHLELPWPGTARAAGRHQLWARLITPDGQKLLTSLDLDMGPSGRNQQVRNRAQQGGRATARSTAKRRGSSGWTRRPSLPATEPPRSGTAPLRPARVATRPQPSPPEAPPTHSRPEWQPFR
ncbi:MAG: hypothetical protein A2W31_03930 [Planctomycetes bacterium RBG_16_64_10]|nr:MAG: hypothetical protein A2W31_03930 [Planctomycetes bacterium RBG_16_64_10]